MKTRLLMILIRQRVEIGPSSISHLPTIVGGNAIEVEIPVDDFVDYQQDEILENLPDIVNDDPQDVEPKRSSRDGQQSAAIH